MELKMANVTRLVPARSAELLSECQRMAADRLPSSLKIVLDKVDDTLFELANKADNSHKQNLYFDAMREIRLKRDEIESDFINTFNKEFENSLDLDKATGQEVSFTPELELSLVDSDEVEESLAVTNFVESVRAKCKDELFGLDQRMGYLLSDPDVVDGGNPLGPTCIGNCFKTACKRLDSDIEVKLTLFKLFDRFAGHGIHQLYADVNEFLVRRDVLPKITTTYRPHGGGSRTRVIIESDDQQIEAAGPDVFSTLQELMTNAPAGFSGFGAPRPATPGGFGAPGGVATNVGGQGVGFPAAPPGASATGGPSAGGPVAVASTANLVDTLTLLQHGNTSGLQGVGAESFEKNHIAAGNVNVLRSLRETGAIGDVNQTDGLTLDIVTILFDYVLDDPAIPDAMKALIGRLQIPMLKVALLDKALFSKKSHPARRLLDALASAAVGWSDRDQADDRLYDIMEAIVFRIVNDFEDDISMFEQALEELETFLAAEEAEAEQRAAESAESLRTRERIVMAKMAVDDAIKDRLDETDVRAFIRQFITDYWRQLLIITHVEQGDESEIWHDQLRTIDDLIWSIQEKTTPQDRKALTEKLPGILRSIKRGMATLEMEPATCSKFLSMLASVHVVSVKQTEEATLAERHLLGGEEDEPLTENQPEKADEFVKQRLSQMFDRSDDGDGELDFDLSMFTETAGDDSEEPESLSPDIMKFVEQVTQLDLGDWVEFDNDDDSTMRARFTWISPATGRYLFTTRQGQKAVDTTLTGLAAQFADGTARRVETQPDPIFDRAIGDLMEKLETQQA